MSYSVVSVLYLISALLFIFALRGLSHPESSRIGNILGIIGMVLAVFTTLMFQTVLSYLEIGISISHDEIESFPPSSSETTCMRRIPLPSRANMEDVRTALMNSD